MTLIVRDATLEDAADILGICNFAAPFAVVGGMPEPGCQFARWLDLVLMQKRLARAVRP